MLVDVVFGYCKIEASITIAAYNSKNPNYGIGDCVKQNNPPMLAPLWWKNHWLDRSGGKYEVLLSEPLEDLLGQLGPQYMSLLRDKFRFADVYLIVYYKYYGVALPFFRPNFEARFVGRAHGGTVDWSRQTIDHEYIDPYKKEK